MAEREGVSKFLLEFDDQDCLTASLTAELDGWRHVLHRLELIGRQADRYQGLGYGNISCRYGQSGSAFIISGTQTGHKPFLGPADYALVTDCDPISNRIQAKGLTRPSSEALTHGQLYRHDPAIGAVVHGHCPEIWRNAERLELPLTPRSIPYGTPAMAEAVQLLLASGALSSTRLLVMGGHEDGVVSVGRDLREACLAMIAALAAALVG
jgi:L-ribulose-5-phosphate 4-epimerase